MTGFAKRTFSLVTVFLSVLLVLTFSAIAVFAYFWISHEYRHFDKEVSSLREAYLADQKMMLQYEVGRALNYVQYNATQAEQRLKSTIQHRVNEAYEIAWNLYREHVDRRSDAEIQKIILDALRPIRFHEGRGYYFATRLDGVEMLFADRPELEGQNLLDIQDTQGQPVIRDMIELVNTSGEGFYRYTWTKPGSTGRDFDKIAFVKHFEPYDWFLGTGEYLEDVERDLQQEVLARLIEIRFGEEGYLFGSSYRGDPLFTSGVVTIGGDSLWELTDPNGVKIFQEYRNAIEQPEGGFVNYAWPKLNEKEATPKLSFVKGFPSWQWIIGAGVYLDEFDTIIAQQQDALTKRIQEHIRKIFSILLVLLAGVAIVAGYMSHTIRKNFRAFSAFFANAATKTSRITGSSLAFSEFEELAAAANHMVDEQKSIEQKRRHAEGALRESEERYRTLSAELEQRVKLRTSELESANKELKDFAYVVSHDLKAPLRSISRLAYWLTEDYQHSFDETGQEMAELLIGRVKRLDNLIEGLLHYSKIGRVGGKSEWIDVGSLVKHVLELLEPPERIHCHLEGAFPSLFGDRFRLEEVFRHLLDNAIQYMGDGPGTIVIGCHDDEADWIFSVADNGPGIDPKYHRKIFEIFQTLQARDIHESRGIGLALVKKIVESYGGRVWVESERGEGSMFLFTLPKTAPFDEPPVRYS